MHLPVWPMRLDGQAARPPLDDLGTVSHLRGLPTSPSTAAGATPCSALVSVSSGMLLAWTGSLFSSPARP